MLSDFWAVWILVTVSVTLLQSSSPMPMWSPGIVGSVGSVGSVWDKESKVCLRAQQEKNRPWVKPYGTRFGMILRITYYGLSWKVLDPCGSMWPMPIPIKLEPFASRFFCQGCIFKRVVVLKQMVTLFKPASKPPVHLIPSFMTSKLSETSLAERLQTRGFCSFNGTGFLLISVPQAATSWPFAFNFLKTMPISWSM